ncbi:MAG TPA: hypothetical protein VLK65_22390 [Vicinamibacteria bacterium]|nr:hypothetical protein [Vicinamibacteria bacterium]
MIAIMKNFGAVVVALGLCQTSSGQSQFQVNPGAAGQSGAARLELSGFIGGSSFQQSLGTASNIYQTVSGTAGNIDFGKLFGLRASWALTRNIAAEFNLSTGTNAYTFAVDDIEVGNVDLGGQFEADQLFWNGSIVFQVPTRAGVVPYATAGFGRLETTPSSPLGDIDKVKATDVSFGGGLKFWLPSLTWLGLRFDARYHTASEGLNFPGNTETPTGTEVTVGATVRLF